MTKGETKTYLQARIKMLKNRKQNWMTHLIDTCKYKNPALINLNHFDHYPNESYLDREETLYHEIFPGERPTNNNLSP